MNRRETLFSALALAATSAVTLPAGLPIDVPSGWYEVSVLTHDEKLSDHLLRSVAASFRLKGLEVKNAKVYKQRRIDLSENPWQYSFVVEMRS